MDEHWRPSIHEAEVKTPALEIQINTHEAQAQDYQYLTVEIRDPTLHIFMGQNGSNFLIPLKHAVLLFLLCA